ncbi:endonuclease MutS2, partial [Chloroflexota bacterium]
SNTGATLFVEPLANVEMGNELHQLARAEKREVERILTTLSADVGASEEAISRNVALVAELDLALAKARYAERVGATVPVAVPIGDGSRGKGAGVLRLVEARHPLLREKAVPLSVEIGHDFSSLIITGPNTGGKTVALKTVAVLTLMAQAGIPIPAAEGSIPIFDGVFADIGDEQSIEQALSTFSWHMSNIVHILNNATNSSLVLLDELGTSTDPGEGAALARAILLNFLSRGTMVVATTHFNELKAFAHTTPGMENASLDFDPVTLAPTYHLMVGIPGGSNALATASRLGLPAEIIDNARELLAEGSEKIETLIVALMSARQRMETLREEMAAEKEAVKELRASLDSEQARLMEQKISLIQETKDRLVRETAELKSELRRIATELKKARSREAIEQGKKDLASVHKQLGTGVWQEDTGRTSVGGEVVGSSRIEVGDRVWVSGTSLQGTVVSINARQLEVQAGQTRIRLSPNSVEKALITDQDVSPKRPSVKIDLNRRAGSIELDLRGKRAGEVDYELDNYLNDAALASLSQVRIIHGAATGTVRRMVRELLAFHPLVKSFRPGKPGEGGDGVTMVEL